MAMCVRTRTHKLNYYQGLDIGELYDLEKDPGEFHNLWPDPGARTAKEAMLVEMAARAIDTVDPLPERHAPW
jgi:hypothetical protein